MRLHRWILVLAATAILAGGSRAGRGDWASALSVDLPAEGLETTRQIEQELADRILRALAGSLDEDGRLPLYQPRTPIIYSPMPQRFQVGYGRPMYRLGSFDWNGYSIGVFNDHAMARDEFNGVSVGTRDDHEDMKWLEENLASLAAQVQAEKQARQFLTEERLARGTDAEQAMVRALAARLARTEEIQDKGRARRGHIETALDGFLEGLGNLDLTEDFYWDGQVVQDFTTEVAEMEVDEGSWIYDEGPELAERALELLETKVGYYIQFFPKDVGEYSGGYRNGRMTSAEEDMRLDVQRFAAYYTWLSAREDVSGDIREDMRASYEKWQAARRHLRANGDDVDSAGGTLGQ